MASTSASGDAAFGSKVTVALFIMRLTLASATPGCFSSIRWTRAWQAAHVMPLTGMRMVSVAVPPSVDASRVVTGLVVVLMLVSSSLSKAGHDGLRPARRAGFAWREHDLV